MSVATTSFLSAAAQGGTRRSRDTVACLVIGDEVLGGKTRDSNAHFLARLCFASGLSLKRIVVVADDGADIARLVRELSDEFGHVVTSGGIGPTHDDITYDSIAKAFGLSLKQHNDTIEKMKAIAHARDPSTPFDLNTGRLRMATLPHPATVSHPCKDLWVPIVTVNGNVSIFPGVPRLFEQLVSNFVQDSIVPSVPGLKQFYRMQIGTPKMESEIADVLTAWQKQVDPVGIKIGSYPKWAPETVVDTEGVSRSMRVVVSVVGQDQDAVEKTIAGIQSDLDAFRVKL
ncbi:MoaB/Mog domain-containing protein [Chytriomyces sp. MP71]|nr:MoaB/Mog domain-containing protein [Chytriomyces sp. MP71]